MTQYEIDNLQVGDILKYCFMKGNGKGELLKVTAVRMNITSYGAVMKNEVKCTHFIYMHDTEYTRKGSYSWQDNPTMLNDSYMLFNKVEEEVIL